MPEGACSCNNTETNPDGAPEGFVFTSVYNIKGLIDKSFWNF
jgi:hypothetical protein